MAGRLRRSRPTGEQKRKERRLLLDRRGLDANRSRGGIHELSAGARSR